MALPPGLSAKTVTIGIGSFFDGTLAGGQVTVSAPVNVIHSPTGRPIFSSDMTKPFVDGATYFDLCPTDAPGLNRVDWVYKLKVFINGAITQPEPIYFLLNAAGPDTVDLDALVSVPSSAGTPVSTNAVVLPSGGGAGQALLYTDGTGVAWGPVQARLTPTATKTANYTVAVGEEAVIDLTSGPKTVTLPTAPTNGSTVSVRALNASTTNVLTVARGGSDTVGSSGATSVTLPLSGESTVLRYDSGATRWLAVSNVKPLAALDTRYGDTGVATLVGTPASATSVALRAALGSADPVLSAFSYDPTTGNLLSYQEDGITITLTYNADQTVATSQRGTATPKAYSYSSGNLVGVA